MILSGTGHRPQELFISDYYSEDNRDHLTRFLSSALQVIRPEIVISGMALGMDTSLALAALELEITLWCAVPFEGQEKKWAKESQETFKDILTKAASVVYVDKMPAYNPDRLVGYQKEKMQRRNEFMINYSHKVLALYNESGKGGTANCVRYAESKGKTIINLWQNWCNYRPKE